MAVILGGIPTDIDVNDLPDEVDENDPIMSTLVGLKKLMSGWDSSLGTRDCAMWFGMMRIPTTL